MGTMASMQVDHISHASSGVYLFQASEHIRYILGLVARIQTKGNLIDALRPPSS